LYVKNTQRSRWWHNCSPSAPC